MAFAKYGVLSIQPRLGLPSSSSFPNSSCANLDSPNRRLSNLPTPVQTLNSTLGHQSSPRGPPPPAMMRSPPAASPNCAFCTISKTYPAPISPSSSTPPQQAQPPNLSSELTSPPTFLVLHSSPICIAFLDIMPLSPGHLLLTTRAHREKVSEVSDEEARELGRWLRVLSRVLARVTGVWDWNIVQNNGMLCCPSPRRCYSREKDGGGERWEDGRVRLMMNQYRSSSSPSRAPRTFPRHTAASAHA
jgi:diadenosine tetraphosphate (Ap4A) HIT family hydrolase